MSHAKESYFIPDCLQHLLNLLSRVRPRRLGDWLNKGAYVAGSGVGFRQLH
ncbi:hypothetical protein [Pyrobaculum aerophilum]|uniref:hypothetical protein n=1 Tax=Pyrobaculum aerophilum TaxID=13773 RepID=UPI0023F4D15A|nr:hypothetical protein [Pyrobaculum aerophilum]MCX8137961.1 hypothetical protein [Pyrobaculum aerophilum]